MPAGGGLIFSMQASLDFSAPAAAVLLRDVESSTVATWVDQVDFSLGDEGTVDRVLSRLRDRLTGKDYKSLLALLERAFDLCTWSGYDLNRILSTVEREDLCSVSQIAELVGEYVSRPALRPKARPFAHLIQKYLILRRIWIEKRAAWAGHNLKTVVLPSLYAQHSYFGNPDSMKAEFLLQEELNILGL